VNARSLLPGEEKCYRERACRVCSKPGPARHHLVPRSQGGLDVEANIIPLCTACHLAFHQGTNWAYYASTIRARLRLDEELYVVRQKGKAWLDRRYPSDPEC
jgi:5-methylcytosine-specific restriction endonuclease McrA